MSASLSQSQEPRQNDISPPQLLFQEILKLKNELVHPAFKDLKEASEATIYSLLIMMEGKHTAMKSHPHVDELEELVQETSLLFFHLYVSVRSNFIASGKPVPPEDIEELKAFKEQTARDVWHICVRSPCTGGPEDVERRRTEDRKEIERIRAHILDAHYDSELPQKLHEDTLKFKKCWKENNIASLREMMDSLLLEEDLEARARGTRLMLDTMEVQKRELHSHPFLQCLKAPFTTSCKLLRMLLGIKIDDENAHCSDFDETLENMSNIRNHCHITALEFLIHELCLTLFKGYILISNDITEIAGIRGSDETDRVKFTDYLNAFTESVDDIFDLCSRSPCKSGIEAMERRYNQDLEEIKRIHEDLKILNEYTAEDELLVAKFDRSWNEGDVDQMVDIVIEMTNVSHGNEQDTATGPYILDISPPASTTQTSQDDVIAYSLDAPNGGLGGELTATADFLQQLDAALGRNGGPSSNGGTSTFPNHTPDRVVFADNRGSNSGYIGRINGSFNSFNRGPGATSRGSTSVYHDPNTNTTYYTKTSHCNNGYIGSIGRSFNSDNRETFDDEEPVDGSSVTIYEEANEEKSFFDKFGSIFNRSQKQQHRR